MISSGVIAVFHFQPAREAKSHPTPNVQPHTDKQSISNETPFTQTILRTAPIPDLPGFPDRQENLTERLINKTLPKLLAQKEGSYTNLTDLLKTGDPRTLDLNSNWMTTHLFPNRTLPLMRMRVIQDPDTGEYRISGGALTLPGTGLEAGYETGFNSDERKATLQWKKSF